MVAQSVRDSFVRHLKVINTAATKRFHRVGAGHDKEEFVAEVVALSWRSWIQCVRDGKNPEEFVTVLVDYNCRAYCNGRRLARGRSRSDVSNPAAQHRGAFKVEDIKTRVEATYVERTVRDILDPNWIDPAAAAVARLSFEDWSRQLSSKRLAVLSLCLEGDSTTDIAAAMGTSAGAVSQHRRGLHDGLKAYLDA